TFTERFDSFAKAHPFTQAEDLIMIGENEITFDNYNLLRSFAPFGEGWREPTFLLKNIATNTFTRIGNNAQHLAIPLTHDVKIIGFNYPFDEAQNKDEVDLVGKFRLNRFKNHITLNFVLEN
ncbi:MAG: hypothetical protein MJ207_03945, partial [Bacilli bacterium]|nr:hypothetical protein [Bacilli bacterium]